MHTSASTITVSTLGFTEFRVPSFTDLEVGLDPHSSDSTGNRYIWE